jgi:hypothetical protein
VLSGCARAQWQLLSFVQRGRSSGEAPALAAHCTLATHYQKVEGLDNYRDVAVVVDHAAKTLPRSAKKQEATTQKKEDFFCRDAGEREKGKKIGNVVGLLTGTSFQPRNHIDLAHHGGMAKVAQIQLARDHVRHVCIVFG